MAAVLVVVIVIIACTTTMVVVGSLFDAVLHRLRCRACRRFGEFQDGA